jgi:hypothetical protein
MGDSQMSNTDWSKVTIDDEFSTDAPQTSNPNPGPKPIRQSSPSSPQTGLPDFPDINELAAAQSPPPSQSPTSPTNPRHVTVDYSARAMQGLPEIDDNPTLNPAYSGRPVQSSGSRIDDIRRSESGGRDYDQYGRPLTSPKGALFAMQVMPATARNPGFGITPVRDQSPQEYNRVGREYYSALVNKYGGDEIKAAAAYNAGPGAVDNAIARGGENYLSVLPGETQAYVQNVFKGTPLAHKFIDPHRKDRVRNILGYDPWGEIDTTPPLTDWDKTIADDPDVRKNFNFFDGIGSILQGVFVEAPKEAIAAGLSAYRGGEIGKNPWLDQYIKERRENHDTWVKKWGLDDNSTFLGISAEHFMNLPKSLGFSGIAAIVGLGAGAGGTLVGGPVGGYAAGMAGSGAAAYRMAADGFLDELHQAINAESMNVRGRGVSPEEWGRIAEHYQNSAQNYGLWEAIPEAIGNAISFGVITGTIKGFLGKEFVQQGMLKGLIKGGEKFGEMYAGELATETVTQMGQGYEEAKIGLRDHAPGAGEAFSEVFWPTMLQTTIMGGMGMGAKYAWDKFKGQPAPAPETDQATQPDVAGVPAVQSGVPAVQGGLPAIQSGVPATQAGVPGFPNQQVIRPQPIPRDTPIDMLSGEPLQGLPSGQDFETQGEPYGPPPPTRPAPPPTQQIPPFQNFQTVGQPYGPVGDSAAQSQESFDAIPAPPPVRRQLPAPVPMQPTQQAQELWQMTRQEFTQAKADQRNARGWIGATPHEGARLVRRPDGTVETIGEHQKAVEDALSQGLPVSPNVLADYPGMTRQPAPAPDQNAAISAQIDEAAHDAATSPFNVKNDPTDGQLQAGNYKKAHVVIDGMDISIENPKGSVRRGVDKKGKPWETVLKNHYGYIRSLKSTKSDKAISETGVASAHQFGNRPQTSSFASQSGDEIKVVGDFISRIKDLDSSLDQSFRDSALANAKTFADLSPSDSFVKQLNSIAKIPLDKAQRRIKPFLDQATTDYFAANAHLFGNFSNGELLRSKGFDAFDVDVQSVMYDNMRSALNDKQILNSIIKLIPIDVMNVLMGKEFSPKTLLDNPSVLLDRLPTTFNNSVGIDVSRLINAIATSLPRAFTLRVAKKMPGFFNSPSAPTQGSTTKITGNVSQSSSPSYYSPKGSDKDHVDVFINGNGDSGKVYIVDQIDPETMRFDEHKIILGVLSEDEARQTYLANYEPGWQGLGAITEMPVSEFKTWVKDKEKTTKPVKYVEGKTEPVSDIEAIKERVSHYQSEVDRLTRTIGRKKNHPDEIKLRSATQRLREWKDTLADVEGKSSPIDEIEREAKEIADLTAKLKDRAMIYQVDEKERLAKKHGKPLDAYYDLSYSEWSAIRDQQSAPEPSGITEPPRQEPRQEQQAGEVGEVGEPKEEKAEPQLEKTELKSNEPSEPKSNESTALWVDYPYNRPFTPKNVSLNSKNILGIIPDAPMNGISDDSYIMNGSFAVKVTESQYPKWLNKDVHRVDMKVEDTFDPEDFTVPLSISSEFFHGRKPSEKEFGFVPPMIGLSDKKGKFYAAYKSSFINAILTLHPTATPFTDKSKVKTAIFKVDGKMVGVAMPFMNIEPGVEWRGPGPDKEIQEDIKEEVKESKETEGVAPEETTEGTAPETLPDYSETAREWDALSEQDRLKTVMAVGWRTNAGAISGDGRRIAASKWDDLSGSAKSILHRNVRQFPTRSPEDAPQFKKGDRVVLKKDTTGTGWSDLNGRHGEISEIITMRTTTIDVFGGSKRKEELHHNYHVKTDQGYVVYSSEKELETETEKPSTPAIPDIEVNGEFKLPSQVKQNIEYERKQARHYRDQALRARLSEKKRGWMDMAKREDAKAEANQKAIDAWVAKYPEEAKRLGIIEGGKKETAAPAPATAPSTAMPSTVSTASSSSTATLADYGLTARRSSTKHGKPVWEITGNTKEYMTILKGMGARWFGPKKAWSFYGDEDPSAKILAKLPKLEGKKGEPEAKIEPQSQQSNETPTPSGSTPNVLLFKMGETKAWILGKIRQGDTKVHNGALYAIDDPNKKLWYLKEENTKQAPTIIYDEDQNPHRQKTKDMATVDQMRRDMEERKRAQEEAKEKTAEIEEAQKSNGEKFKIGDYVKLENDSTAIAKKIIHINSIGQIKMEGNSRHYSPDDYVRAETPTTETISASNIAKHQEAMTDWIKTQSIMTATAKNNAPGNFQIAAQYAIKDRIVDLMGEAIADDNNEMLRFWNKGLKESQLNPEIYPDSFLEKLRETLLSMQDTADPPSTDKPLTDLSVDDIMAEFDRQAEAVEQGTEGAQPKESQPKSESQPKKAPEQTPPKSYVTQLMKAIGAIKRNGAASLDDVSVKIVEHPSGQGGYGIETTVSGDRQYPTGEPIPSLEKAQAEAIKILEGGNVAPRKPAPISSPSPTSKLKEAGSHIQKILDGAKRINAILGERGALSNEEVDPEKYAQIKPILKEMWDEAVAAGQNVGEFVKLVLESLSAKGRAYLKKFLEEEMSGENGEKSGTEVKPDAGFKDKNIVGYNQYGDIVRLDDNTNRYYVSSAGFRISAPILVSMMGKGVGGGGVLNAEQLFKDGRHEFLTKDELDRFKGEEGKGKDSDSSTEKDSIPSAESIPPQTASNNLASWVTGKIRDKQSFDWRELFAEANKSFGGTQAEGKYSPKDAYDAMELGVNRAIANSYLTMDPSSGDLAYTRKTIKELQDLISKLPTQTRRTEEMDEFQQFSTPPPLAYLAAWVGNVSEKDTVLEPSAGIGGIAVMAKLADAKVYVNELSSRRAELLKLMGFDGVFTENAEQINNILPKEVAPTVVLMNPPFSATAGRIKGQRNTSNAERHIEQALARLQPNGRLVAIVGRGMGSDAPQFRDWFAKISKNNTLQADIKLSGEGYVKYGTSFDNRILVIDKVQPNEQHEPIKGSVEDVLDALPLLEGVRNARLLPQDKTVESPAPEQGMSQGTEGSQSESGSVVSSQSPVDAMGTKRQEGGRRPGYETGDRINGRSGPEADNEPASGRSGRGFEQPSTEGQSKSGGSVGNADRSGQEPDSGVNAGSRLEVVAGQESSSEISDSVYDEYRPSVVVPGAKRHPGSLVESAAMASVKAPPTTYRPAIDNRIIATGKLSDAQLENIIRAGEAHSTLMDNKERQGYFIGDGTGVGKGREIAGIFLDNWNQGRKKGIWLSANSSLYHDAKRDIEGIGDNPDKVIDLSKIKVDKPLTSITGIIFTTYDTLKNKGKAKEGKDGKKRIDQIIEWLGPEFDGVIAMDESHRMGSAVEIKGTRGKKSASQTALAGIELQNRLPNARVVYVSATGATEVLNLAYAKRLNLWGQGTAFPDVKDFVNQISSGGIAAMELVARDLKSMGKYLARSLSYHDVTYDKLEHALTEDQRMIYDKLAEGWQSVLNNLNEALTATGVVDSDGKTLDGQAKSAAMSAFWGAHQRFFNQVITSLQMPSVLEKIQNEMDNGNSIVIQLVNTNEASLNRAIAKLDEEDTLEDLDLTPRDQLAQYITNSFPVNQFEQYEDEDGNVRSRPVVDSMGNPVINQEALAIREQLLNDIGSIRVPDGPLEMVLNEFGVKNVAEVTGRTQRVVIGPDGKRVKESRSKAKTEADAKLFQDGKKRILVFSQAGGTGLSYHADITAKNQQKRIHFLVQAGWRADVAVQGFGRTHRSNQEQAPHYILVTTDLKGQKRFLSSIARRLDQLGALTKGQRQTGSQGFFQARDNLESRYAQDALERMIVKLMNKGSIAGVSVDEFEQQTGLKLRNEDGYSSVEFPPMTQFLNRLLSLTYDVQNAVFDAFSDELDQVIQREINNGTLDQGLENVKAEKIGLVKDENVHTDEKSGAETKYVELDLTNPTQRVSFKASREKAGSGYYRNKKSGKIWAAGPQRMITNKEGKIVDIHWLMSPIGNEQKVSASDLSNAEKWDLLSKEEAETVWAKQYDEAPATQTERIHLVTGAILPIWDRLSGTNTRIVRIQTDDGKKYLGRLIERDELDNVLKNLGATKSTVEYTPPVIIDLLKKGFSLKLANNWTLRETGVSGERRIEVWGPNFAHNKELADAGVFTERIVYATRYFIPVGDKAESVIEAVTKNRPVVEETPPYKYRDNTKKKKPGREVLWEEEVDTPNQKERAEEESARLKVLSSIRNESGRAVILEDLASYALSLMEKGVDSFVKFKEAARTALGDLYEKVKELLMVAWGKAKEIAGRAKDAYKESRLGDETGAVGNLGKKEDIGQAANQDGQSEQGEKITETPEFRAWFKDSKVVDEDGEPLVVYHGTVSDFSEFDFGKLGEESGHPTSILGFFFTPDIGIANDVVTPELGGIRKNASIMPVYLNIKNPYRITAEQFTRIYDKNEETWDANTSKAMINLRAVVERKGYDGIIVSKNLFRGMDELNADTYIAFSPTQIKSATGNTGAFSTTNPDIRFSMRDDGDFQGISAKRLRNFIADITKKWKNAPIINVVQSVRDLPVNYKEIVEAQTGDIEAFFDPATNTVHFIADNLGSIDRVQRVLLHEVVGHHGLSAILAPSKLKPFLNQVFMAYGKSGLQSIADEYGYDLSTEEGRLKAAEEKLAELVEMGDKPSLLNRLMALIREALRSIGFTLELNDLDIYQVLYRAGRYVRDGHEGGGFRFSFPPSIQSSSLKATEMATFRKWFGKSVVKDEDGTPKIVYRGDSITPDRTVMEPRQGGDLGSGTYFAEEHHVAEEFTEGTDKAHVKQYYLKLENPLNLMDRNLKDNPSMKNILKAMPEGSNKALLNDWLDGKLDVKHAYGFLARVTSNTMDTFNRFLAGYGFDGVMDRGVRGVSDGEWQYVVFSPNQVKSATDNTGAFDPNNPDVRFSIKNTPKNPSTYQKDHVAFDYKSGFDWSNEGLSKLATKVYTKVIDAEYPAIKLAKEIGGEPAAKFISDLVDRVRARSSIAESNLMEGLTHLDNNGSPMSYGQSLHEILKNLRSQEEMMDYDTMRNVERVIALEKYRGEKRRALDAAKTAMKDELKKLKKEPGYGDRPTRKYMQAYRDTVSELKRTEKLLSTLPIDGAREELTRIEAKYGAQRMADLRKISAGHRQFEEDAILMPLVQSGKMSRESFDAIRSAPESAFYASFMREMDDVEGQVVSGQVVAAGKTPSAAKRLKGSERRMIPSIEATIANLANVTKLVETQRLNKEFVKLRNISPEAADLIKPMKVDASKGAPRDSLVIYENGKTYYYSVPPDVAKAINYYQPNEMSFIWRMLSIPATTLRYGATLAADFVVRNPVRDQFTAMVYSKHGYVPFVDLARGMIHFFKNDAVYREFKAAGGEQGYFSMMDREATRLKAEDIAGIKREGKDRLIQLATSPLRAWQMISQSLEAGTRIAEYEKAKAAGHSPLEAMGYARDLTLNFQRKGGDQIIRAMNGITAFWNANVQGTDKLVREITGKDRKWVFIKAGLGITLPSIILWGLFHDDDRWKNLPDWRKNFFWNIPIPDGPIISIPKPFELGLIFGSLPERIMDWMFMNDPKAIGSVATAIKDGLFPGLIPTAALPIVESMTNYSFFRDQRIETQADMNLPAGMRANQGTSEVLKRVGMMTDISPKMMENWVRDWTGNLGKMVLDIADLPLESAEVKPVSKKWYEVTPGVRGFVSFEPIGSAGKQIDRFYDYLDEATNSRQGYKVLAKTDPKEAAAFRIENETGIRFARNAHHVAEQLSNLRKRKASIMQSKDLDSEAKRERIDRIDRFMSDLAGNFNKRYEAALTKM